MPDTPARRSDPEMAPETAPQQRGRRFPIATVLSFLVGLVGVAALAATAWVYAETQREIVRISTDIAQIRVSLDIYGQRQPPAAAAAAAGNDDSLRDLSNRLAILEQSWRSAPPAAVPSAVPAGAAPDGDAVASGGDCLPTGTRFMVSAGDSYAVCGTTGSIEIAGVDNGFITLGDGTVIAQGGNIGLPGTRCMVGLLPSDGGGMSGFAEIRVSC